jgi:ubiquinone/menaquinone biosynthesis C-methylase UbiE
MKSEYRDLFDARGGHYNLANCRFPEARAEEARALLEHLSLAAGTTWLDLGAGGGFLAERAAKQGLGGPAVGCDESMAFLAGASAYALRTIAAFRSLPYPDGTFAAAASLAALHHAEDPEHILSEMLRVTSPGGRVAVGDVAAESSAARFLNGFLDGHTTTGHAGRFYDAEAWAGMLARSGGRGIRVETVKLSWRFGRSEDARVFSRELFGLVPETTDSELDDAMAELGLFEDAGRWRLPWKMVFASARRG